MGNFDTQMNEATMSFAYDLVELIKNQVIEETAKALELEAGMGRAAKAARLVERKSKALVVVAKRAKREVRRASGTVEERIVKLLSGGALWRSAEIAKELDLLHPSTRRSLQTLERRKLVTRRADGWERV